MRHFMFPCIMLLCAVPATPQHFTSIGSALQSPEKVRVLNLSGQSLKQIPELKEFRNLEVLVLRNNFIQSTKVNGGYPASLRVIDVSGNAGIDVRDLLNDKSVSGLREVDLSYCGLTYLPHVISNLKHLQDLDLSDNLITEIPREIASLKKLKKLDVSRNDLRTLPIEISYLKSLRDLNCSGNDQLSFYEVADVISSRGLTYLTVGPIAILGGIPEHAGLIGTLTVKNSEVESIEPSLLDCKGIGSIQLVNCSFTSPELAFLMLNNVPGLHAMSVHATTIPEGLQRMTILDELELDIDLISATDFATLQNKLRDCRIINQGSIGFAPQRRSIAPPIQHLNPSLHEFILSNQLPARLETNRTVVNIPKNAFLTAEGVVYSGKVTFGYREFMDPVDMMLSGIPMLYDTAGTSEIFSSAGMMEITAYGEWGESLKPNPDALINVAIKTDRTSSNYHMYTFMPNQGRWEYQFNDMVRPVLQDEVKKDDMEIIDLTTNDAPLTRINQEDLLATRNFISESEKIHARPERPHPGKFLFDVEKLAKEQTFALRFTHLRMNSKTRNYLPFFDARELNRMTFKYDGDSASIVMAQLKQMRKEAWKSYGKPAGRTVHGTNRNYFLDVVVRLNEGHDNYLITLASIDTVITFPVYLETNRRTPQAVQARNDRFYRGYNISLQKRVNDWTRKLEKYDRDVEAFESYLESGREELLASMASNGGGNYTMERVFVVTGFGIWNCDAIQRMAQPTPLMATFTNHDGTTLEPTKAFVLDLTSNGVLSYDTQQEIRYDKGSRNALVLMLEGGYLAYASADDFERHVERNRIPLTVVSAKEIDLDQLKRILL